MECLICWNSLREVPEDTSTNPPDAKRLKLDKNARPSSEFSNIVTTRCGHVFHRACLEGWLKNDKSCPACRREVLEDSLIPIFLDVQRVISTELLSPTMRAAYVRNMADEDINCDNEQCQDLRQRHSLLRADYEELERKYERERERADFNEAMFRSTADTSKECESTSMIAPNTNQTSQNIENDGCQQGALEAAAAQDENVQLLHQDGEKGFLVRLSGTTPGDATNASAENQSQAPASQNAPAVPNSELDTQQNQNNQGHWVNGSYTLTYKRGADTQSHTETFRYYQWPNTRRVDDVGNDNDNDSQRDEDDDDDYDEYAYDDDDDIFDL